MKRFRSCLRQPLTVAALLVCLAWPRSGHASLHSYALGDAVRKSSMVAWGEVSSIREDGLVLRVRGVLKGVSRPDELTIVWSRHHMARFARYAVGNSVLVFAYPAPDGSLHPLGPDGIVPVEDIALGDYRSAVHHIFAIDAAMTPNARTQVVRQMLDARRSAADCRAT
jgi:hypothetical protein